MNPSPDSSHQRSSPTGMAVGALSSWLKNLGLLLFGVGLGAIGVKWMTIEPNSLSNPQTRALEVEASPDNSSFSEFDAPSSKDQRSDAQQSSQDKAKVADAAVCVKTTGPTGEDACASGVSIDPQLAGIDPKQGAVVLTNYHVVADRGNRTPVQLSGKGEVFYSEVIQQSPEFDLALLLVSKAQFPIAALAESSPEQGIAVQAIGFPDDQPLTIKASTLLGETQDCLAVSPCLAMQQGTITHGNSGGPLEADGQVIGITQGETTDEIAIPVEQIRQFLSGQIPSSDRLPPQFDRSFPMREPYPYPPSFNERYPRHDFPPSFNDPHPPPGWS